MKLYKSNKPRAGKRHEHIVYVNEKTGVYEVSRSQGHTHNVILNADGTFLLEPDATDGHFHDQVYELEMKYPTRPEVDDEEVVQKLYEMAKVACKWSEKSLKQAIESDKMYKGEQWNESEKRDLESEGRAALVINMIEKHIDDLVGYQRQQRTDPNALPNGESDQRLADIANELIKIILTQCEFEFTENEVFEDGCVCGVGNFCLEVSQKDDIRGDLRIKKYPYDQVFFGEHTESDASDCEYLVKVQRWSFDKLKAAYNKKREELEESTKVLENKLSQEIQSTGETYAGDDYIRIENMKIPASIGDSPVINKAKKEVLVVEKEEKIYVPVSVIYDSVAEESLTTYGFSESDLKQIQSIPNLYRVDKEIQKMRVTRCAGTVLLMDDYISEIPDDDFTIVPFYAKKRGADYWGKVKSGKDPQRELNKRVSQSVDIVNFASLYGIVFDEMTFASPSEEKNFKENGNKPGFIAKVQDIRNKPELFQGIKLPSEVLAIADTSESRLERLLSVDATRFAGANTSAYAIQQARESALVGNEYLFKNMKRAKKRLITKMIAYIQKYYSPKRIYRMLSNQNARQPFSVGEVPFGEYSPDEIVEFLRNSDLTKIDITIDETSWSPTQRAATLNVIQEVAKSGFPVPPDILPELLNTPQSYKDRMLQSIMQQQESQAASAEGTQETEVVKSLIGQGLVPPSVLEKYGLGSNQATSPQLPEGQLPPGVQTPIPSMPQ